MYPSDLSDKEWELICHYFEHNDRRGSSHKHPKKSIVDAILYVVKGGIPWRLMPNDFPGWKTVYDHFRKWNQRGVWEAALDQLNQIHRRKKGRTESPSYGIIDSQSVKTQYASDERGFDGHKKVKGRKRHGVVDILGNLVTIVVHAATQSDTVAGCQILAKASKKHKTIKAFSRDQGYQGTAVEFVKKELGLSLTIPAKEEGGLPYYRNGGLWKEPLLG